MITVTILKDITPKGWSTPFYRRGSRIEYDAKRPTDQKRHVLVHQQGDYYGAIGDASWTLTHDELLELERGGFVRITGRVSR
jgi:hypothetical protein